MTLSSIKSDLSGFFSKISSAHINHPISAAVFWIIILLSIFIIAYRSGKVELFGGASGSPMNNIIDTITKKVRSVIVGEQNELAHDDKSQGNVDTNPVFGPKEKTQENFFSPEPLDNGALSGGGVSQLNTQFTEERVLANTDMPIVSDFHTAKVRTQSGEVQTREDLWRSHLKNEADFIEKTSTSEPIFAA